MLINSPINILIISTDHYKKEPYDEYRHGSNYENFISNITRIKEQIIKYQRVNTLYTRASGVAVDKEMDLKEGNAFYLNYFDESRLQRCSKGDT